jgi:hypothetical protein
MNVTIGEVVCLDDDNEIICSCGAFVHPNNIVKHEASTNHIEKLLNPNLTKKDRKLIKTFKKKIFIK